MSEIPFSVSARTARLIGRENVANAEGALIELVKNCYDADSKTAIIIVDKPNDCVYIIDEGDGMDKNIIEQQWMTIGTDEKLYNAIAKSGRIKAGAKGIGRFALDRLGDKCEMVTFAKNRKGGLRWKVDWAAFETKKNGRNVRINEVFAELTEINNNTYKKEVLKEVANKAALNVILKWRPDQSGTLLKISSLRDEWTDSSLKKVYENLELLNPPDGNANFKMYLFAGTSGKYGIVNNNDFSDYDYKVHAKYQKNSKHEISISVNRNEFDLALIEPDFFKMEEMKQFPYDKKTFAKGEFKLDMTLEQLLKSNELNKARLNDIGDFEFIFYFLKNSFSKEDRLRFKYKDFLGDRGAWLDRFGGIKLYRDNFRIRPYGEVGTQAYDWLMLGERHGQNPAGVARKGSRVRSNQVAGVVKLSRIKNPYLEDKSSREGLQENETFELFKNLLLGIIKVQEDDRSTIGFNLNEYYKAAHSSEQDIEESDEIVDEDEDVDADASPEEIRRKNATLKRGIRARKEQLADRDDELATSRAMATAGIMIASFSHEFNGMKNDLNSRANDLKRFLLAVVDPVKLKGVPDRKNPIKLIDQLREQDEKIRQWISFSIDLMRKDRRKNKKVDLRKYLENFNNVWTKLFEERDIAFVVNYKTRQELTVRISELDLDSIFDNLITNSIEAFQRRNSHGPKEIEINLDLVGAKVLIVYRDTGPGISKTFKNINDVFRPFETTKKDDLGNEIGTGLGMWLVKSSVDSNKGIVELVRPKSGFEIRIHFTKTK